MSSPNKHIKKFSYGTYAYEYELQRQERQTLSLTVNPDMSIVLKCPRYAGEDRIEAFLVRKWHWLQKQLNFFEQVNKKPYIKEYVSGESFYYLGRQYQLLVKPTTYEKVSLTKGKIFIFTFGNAADGAHNKKLLQAWYDNRMNKVFRERFTAMAKRFDYVNLPELAVRRMKKRWGSYLKTDKIFLNPKLIHASKVCIDYVIVHELCHMRFKNHDKRFYQFLNEKYPGWRQVKTKLEQYHD